MTLLNEMWIRIFDNIGSGVAFILFALMMLYARDRKGVGHHRGLLYTALFCLSIALGHLTRALLIYHGGGPNVFYETPLMLIKFAYVTYVWHNLTDMIITLRRSEFGEKIRQDYLADREQERLNLVYVVNTTRDRALKVWNSIQRRAEHDHPDPALGKLGR